jgi:hypothetical protein
MSLHRGGATVVVMEKSDPAHCLALIERHKVTHAQFVPTMSTSRAPRTSATLTTVLGRAPLAGDLGRLAGGYSSGMAGLWSRKNWPTASVAEARYPGSFHGSIRLAPGASDASSRPVSVG